MDRKRFRIRAGLAAAAAAVLISGAAWRGLAATGQTSVVSSQHSTVAQTSAVTGRTVTVSGSRDSYADVVKNVAPAVVTIRVEGKAAVQPAQFDGDDFFRRFFGDEGDDNNSRGRRQQRGSPNVPR